VSKIVLCVDDSATMQQVADITFRGTEFTYVGARSFDEGLDKAKSQKPTLVLADSHMPGKDKSGYDLCLALKSDAGTSNIPVVILVGNAAPYDTARGAQVGADGNLPKPWDTQTMLEKVTEIVGKAATGVAKPGGAAAGPPVPVAAAGTANKSAPAAVAAAASASMPPRSATIMGMPTIKMPAGNAQPVAPAAQVVPTKTTVMAVPPISPGGTGPGTSPVIRSPAPPPPAPVTAAPPVAAVTAVTAAPPVTAVTAAPPVTAVTAAPTVTAVTAAPAVATMATGAVSRAPMISGTLTKRSLLVERTLAKMAARLAEASGLDAGSPELAALLKLSTEVIERIVWEVVPDLAEQIIRENLHDLTARRS
jgi:CheY-like chemotaxis protein